MNSPGKRLFFSILLVCCCRPVAAQFVLPQIHHYEMDGHNHEDLSDILRLFPGMYPQDLGTLGAPLYFLPWGLWPGQMRYTLDGLPLERRYDGLWDPGLLPVSEIDSIVFESSPLSGLSPGAGGRINFATRELPVDSPLSEIRLREGYYDYGTVDFAHGQPIYRKLTFQLTGRLGWYRGLREQTGLRLTRIRGKLSFRPAKKWRLEALCFRTKSHCDSKLNESGQTLTRTEGQFSFLPTDSMSASFRPSLRFFLREDGERWGEPWRARDVSGGALLCVSSRKFGHHFQGTGLARFSSMNFPPTRKLGSHDIEVGLTDSVGVANTVGIELGGGLRFEKGWDTPAQRYGLRGYVPIAKTCVLFGGVQRLETFPSPLWMSSSYLLAERPLLLSPSLSNLGDSLVACPKEKQRSSQMESGVSADLGGAKLRIAALRIATENGFVPWTTASSQQSPTDSRWGGAFDGRIPLYEGLSFETRWSFLWISKSDLQPSDDVRGFSRLYFDRTFFKAPLHIRTSLSHTYIGKHVSFSHQGAKTLQPVHLVGLRISAQIGNFRIFWGTENIGARHYEYVPGFLMIRKEEYWGFDWIFWY
ncbi:MAG: Plug domain-containing protein [bacterium]